MSPPIAPCEGPRGRRHDCGRQGRRSAGRRSFAVKNLFDVQGLPTRAGSKINRDLKPSSRDATLVERMEAAGAVLVGALNMGEYAYDFTARTYMTTLAQSARCDPDDRRLVGRLRRRGRRRPGAAGAGFRHQWFDPGAVVVLRNLRIEADLWPAVAGALVSVRRKLRYLGPFARSVGDLALAYDAMQGPDPDDAACTTRAAEPVAPLLAGDIGGLRVAIAAAISRRTFSRK